MKVSLHTPWQITFLCAYRIYRYGACPQGYQPQKSDCTDRAHVLIAGAMPGRRVEYRSSGYHKVPAIARYALGGFPVLEIA